MDPRKCQTSTASPAEPGELPFWFRVRYIETLNGNAAVEAAGDLRHGAAILGTNPTIGRQTHLL